MNYTVVQDLDDGLYYYKDDKNNLIGEGYDDADDFASNGLAIVKKSDGKKYYINSNFEIVSEGYKYANNFASNGLARVAKSISEMYYINSNFEIVSEVYDFAKDFGSNGLAIVIKADGKFYYINSECETVSEGFKDANDFASNGLAIVEKSDGKYYYINSKCETVSEGFRKANNFASNGLASVQDGPFYYYINDKFQEVSGNYMIAYSFASNGLAFIYKFGGGYCYINENFEVVSDVFFDADRFQSNNLALVRKNDGKRYFINDKCKIISEGYEYAWDFASNGLARVKKFDGKYYYINSKCETVSEGYGYAYDFGSNGLAKVQKSDGKWYYVDENFEAVNFVNFNKIRELDKIKDYLASCEKDRVRQKSTEISESKNTEREQDNNVVKDELWELLNGKITLKELPDKFYLDFDAVQKISEKITNNYQGLYKKVCEQIESLNGIESEENKLQIAKLENYKNTINERFTIASGYYTRKVAEMCMKANFEGLGEGKVNTQSSNSTSIKSVYNVDGVIKDKLNKFLYGDEISLKELPDECYLDFDAVQKIAVKITYYYQDLHKSVCEKIEKLSSGESSESVIEIAKLENDKKAIYERFNKVSANFTKKICDMYMRARFGSALGKDTYQDCQEIVK